MKRLLEGIGKNSEKEYDRIFYERSLKDIDSFDLLRWKRLIKYYEKGRVIDLGCLDSRALPLLKERYPGLEGWGIDTASEAMRVMQKRYPGIIYNVGDVYDTKFPSGYFSYAIAGELIEHLDNLQKFFEETFRILRRGGILALSTPLEEETEPGAKDKDRHIWSFKEEDIRKLVEPYCSKIKVKIMGSQYFPKYKYNFPNILAYCYKR